MYRGPQTCETIERSNFLASINANSNKLKELLE